MDERPLSVLQLPSPLPAADAAPLLSLIIVSWNVAEMLKACLESVYAETCLPDGALQVVVVDNASADETVAMIRADYPQVTLIAQDENLGFGRANNLGLQHCRGRFIGLLNPDTVVLDGAIDRCLAWLQAHARAGMVGPRLLNTDGSLQRWTAGAFPALGNLAVHHLLLTHLLPRRLQPAPLFLRDDVGTTTRVEWLSGACMLLRRETFGDILFDERFFMYGEDMELCHRIVRAGWDIVYLPAATIYHHQGGSIKRQTSTEVQAAALRGPRIFYAMVQPSRTAQRAADLLTAVGFLLRWLIYAAAARVSSQPRYAVQSRASRRYLSHAVGILLRRGA